MLSSSRQFDYWAEKGPRRGGILSFWYCWIEGMSCVILWSSCRLQLLNARVVNNIYKAQVFKLWLFVITYLLQFCYCCTSIHRILDRAIAAQYKASEQAKLIEFMVLYRRVWLWEEIAVSEWLMDGLTRTNEVSRAGTCAWNASWGRHVPETPELCSFGHQKHAGTTDKSRGRWTGATSILSNRHQGKREGSIHIESSASCLLPLTTNQNILNPMVTNFIFVQYIEFCLTTPIVSSSCVATFEIGAESTSST